MKPKEVAASVLIIVLVVVLLAGLLGNLWTLSAVLSLLAFFLVSGIFGLAVWGFRDRFENRPPHTPERIEKRKFRFEGPARPFEVLSVTPGHGFDSKKGQELKEEKKELLNLRQVVDDYETYSYRLQEGSVLKGLIESNIPVNIFLLDSRNLNLFERNYEFDSYDSSERVTRYSLDFVIPKTRVFHFVIENEDEEEAAEVDIELWLADDRSS